VFTIVGRDPIEDYVVDAPAEDVIRQIVCGVYAAVCNVDTCAPDQGLIDIGGDSIQAAEISAVLANAAGLEVPVRWVLEGPDPASVTDRLLAAGHVAGVSAGELVRRLMGPSSSIDSTLSAPTL
jgi:Phosphopantetheine attachment site